jgi:tryptophan-rich sensory protein
MKIFKLSVLFILINFSALALGSWLMNNGSSSFWYENLQRAPWEPQGWVFGVAWTNIMICFSIYLAFIVKELKINFSVYLFENEFFKLYLFQLLLNILWNYLFFNKHLIEIALLDITLLTILMFYFLFEYYSKIKFKSTLLLPYCIWLVIASSLNFYIVIYN